MTHEYHTSLLQSSLWGNVQKADGRPVLYVDILDNNDTLDVSYLIIKYTLPFGLCWLYSPRPIIENEEKLNKLAQNVAAIAKKENAIFWKIEGIKDNFQIFNFQFSKGHPLQYSETFFVDLTQTEDQLLKNMKQKTRYNIGLARKKGITSRWSKNLEDISLFYKLLNETARRQNICIHTMQHYKNILSIFGKENAAALGIAYYENKPIAANMVIFYGDTATYLHGGTEHAHHNLMAPYLLQWETMREAHRRGLRWYDLGGAAVTRGKIKEWAGITRFKEGFGGTRTNMGETYDVVFSRTGYALYKHGSRLKTLVKHG